MTPSPTLHRYSDILTTLLNDGASPKTGKQILTKSTVDLMFENHIPHMPNFGRQGLGLVFHDHEQFDGKEREGMRAGIANLFWWCDREHGIAGVICTQILRFADPKLVPLWFDVEKQVYDGLK
ncbi:hypothetical protein AJ78_00592 [Emergomyces pasteurianus Ep9510]|uniref:Beta-lactamase-related domain-containing protein n=1 Tax=Emergomyces pasteurianus Ep9510 TaxID=1447872 RepID=A0A1J9PU48_9EURO|nr:hypothetical protein AJ78_00592 [Emergomyces pasteurianus Ep9510]